jgi:hypothetical protein
MRAARHSVALLLRRLRVSRSGAVYASPQAVERGGVGGALRNARAGARRRKRIDAMACHTSELFGAGGQEGHHAIPDY